ncbi:MAG TPA: hypothetical protein VF380_06940 [Solirubrobacteraceae bacterium]
MPRRRAPRAGRRRAPLILAVALLALALSAAAAGALSIGRSDPHVVQPQPRPGSCRARGTGRFSLPDPRCTPGSLNAAVTQATVSSTICRSGYTRTIRPPESVTGAEKRASLAAYGDSGPLRAFEYDHLVSLELGGAANDPRNLWPEPGATPNPKDGLENRLHAMVCSGRITLAAAQRQIAGNWVASYRNLFG